MAWDGSGPSLCIALCGLLFIKIITRNLEIAQYFGEISQLWAIFNGKSILQIRDVAPVVIRF